VRHRTWSYYDKATGVFSGSVITTDRESTAELNAAGRGYIEGAYSHLTQRVDVATGNVVPYQAPSDLSATAIRANTLGQIHRLEASQHRSIRELAIDPLNVQARARLHALEDQIAQLRSRIAG